GVSRAFVWRAARIAAVYTRSLPDALPIWIAEAEHQAVRPGEERGGAQQVGDLGVGEPLGAQRCERHGRRAGPGELGRGGDDRRPALVLARAERRQLGGDPVRVALERGGEQRLDLGLALGEGGGLAGVDRG